MSIAKPEPKTGVTSRREMPKPRHSKAERTRAQAGAQARPEVINERARHDKVDTVEDEAEGEPNDPRGHAPDEKGEGGGDALPRRGPDSLAVKGRCGGTFRWTAPANLHPLPPRFRTAFPAFPSSRLEQSARHPASQRAAANGHSHDETRVSCPLPRRVCVVPVNARQRCIGLCNPFAFPDEDLLLAPSGFPRPPSPRVHDYAKGTQTGKQPSERTAAANKHPKQSQYKAERERRPVLLAFCFGPWLQGLTHVKKRQRRPPFSY